MNKKRSNILSKFISKIQTYATRRSMLFYLLVSFFIVVLLAPWTEQRYDIYVFRLWPALITNYNLYPLGSQLYTLGSQLPSNFPPILGYAYPPIWLYISLPLFSLWQSITRYSLPQDPSDLWIHGLRVNNIAESYRSFIPPALPLLDLLLKLPSILAFVGIGYLLLRLAKKEGREKEVFFLWMLNPYVVHIVAVWGSFDALAAFFAFNSLYLLRRKRNSISAASLSLGFCTKLYPLLFLIPNMIFILKQKGLKASLRYLGVFFLTTSVVFGSFVLLFPSGFEFLSSLLIGRASPDMYGTTSISGITWLGFLNVIQWSGNFPVFPLIFIPMYLILIYFFWTRVSNIDNLSMICVSIPFLFYVSYTVINPQYFLWALPFLLYLVLRRAISKKSYAIISAIPLIWIYIHYNAFYFISPILIWDESNYPPWSYITAQLRPTTFIILGEAILAILISSYILFLLLSTLKSKWKNVSEKS